MRSCASADLGIVESFSTKIFHCAFGRAPGQSLPTHTRPVTLAEVRKIFINDNYNYEMDQNQIVVNAPLSDGCESGEGIPREAKLATYVVDRVNEREEMDATPTKPCDCSPIGDDWDCTTCYPPESVEYNQPPPTVRDIQWELEVAAREKYWRDYWRQTDLELSEDSEEDVDLRIDTLRRGRKRDCDQMAKREDGQKGGVSMGNNGKRGKKGGNARGGARFQSPLNMREGDLSFQELPVSST